MNINKIRRKIQREGLGHTIRYISNRVLNKSYDFGTIVSEEEILIERDAKYTNKPLVSIVTPLFNTDSNHLREMIESVLAQTYDEWELCLLDVSDDKHGYVYDIAKEYAGLNKNIKIKKEQNKGIAENTNECVRMSSGDYIGILDHDDILHPSALYLEVREINAGADFVYSDEVKFKNDLTHLERPNFKPDFSYEELLLHNYICHFNIFSRKLFDAVGGYRKEYDGSQDHDMVLRLTAVSKRVEHVPRILYFWRIHEGSVAGGIQAKPYATMAGVKAINDRLQKMKTKLSVESIHDNVPIYKIRNTKVNGTLTVTVWGTRTEEDKKKIADKISENIGRNVDFRHIDSAVIGSELDNIVKECNSDFMMLLNDNINDRELDASTFNINELLYYSEFSDIAAVDAKLVDGKRLISGGVYKRDDKFGFRSTGMPAIYQGYEADFHHARMVMGVSGICSMLYINNIKSGANRFFWTPFAKADIRLTEVEKLVSKEYYKSPILMMDDVNDHFYNLNISKFDLD